MVLPEWLSRFRSFVQHHNTANYSTSAQTGVTSAAIPSLEAPPALNPKDMDAREYIKSLIAARKPVEPWNGWYPKSVRYDLGAGGALVLDRQTGLIWAAEASSEEVTFEQAQHYTEQLEIGGLRGWRVPTIAELHTLLQSNLFWFGTDNAGRPIPLRDPYPPGTPIDQKYQCNIDTTIFADGAATFWSCTQKYKQRESVWAVDFRFSSDTKCQKTSKQRIRAVLGNTAPSTQFMSLVSSQTISQTNTVTDTRYQLSEDQTMIRDTQTNLVWQRISIPQKMTHTQARKYAEQCRMGGYTDWRLPTVSELSTLFIREDAFLSESTGIIDFRDDPRDRKNQNPWIDTSIFPNGNQTFWSRDQRNTVSAWVVSFTQGNDYENSVDSMCSVLLVL